MSAHYDKYRFYKGLCYGLLLLGIFVLQSARGTGLRLLNASVSAIPFLVCAAALLEGPYTGGILGFFGGLLTALHSTAAEGLSALYLALFGILFGLFGAYYLRQVAPAALVGGVLCITLEAVLRYVFYYLLVFNIGPMLALQQLAGCLLLSLPFGVLVFFLTRRIHQRFTEEKL